MKVFGIILEANPLHLGHKYFIEKIKTNYQPDYLIAITSTSFSMRGDISILDKFTKTSLILELGIDLVLELPFTMAVQSADFFAKNSIDLLASFGITDLIFGSETEDINLYHRLYDFLNNTKVNYDQFKNLSKKQTLNIILENSNFSEDEINLINQPNFTLGFQYIKTIIDNKYPISYHLIKRVANNYHDKLPTNNIASATSIRNLHQNNIDVSNYIPYSSNYLTNLNNAYQNLMPIIKYVYADVNVTNFTYLGKSEGINQYIIKKGNLNDNFDNFIDSLKNKKYSSSLIKRVILHTLLKTASSLSDKKYLRILGSNQRGFEYLKTLPKQTKNLIFSSPKELKENNEILELELSATKLYANITNNNNLFLKEYKLPIRKEV